MRRILQLLWTAIRRTPTRTACAPTVPPTQQAPPPVAAYCPLCGAQLFSQMCLLSPDCPAAVLPPRKAVA